MKILHPTFANNELRFFYDGSQHYFQGAHGAAAILALVVLIVFIIIPTVYLTIYPFKWFQMCFNMIKFKKDLLVSVTDVFTGPYKDGTQDSWDYRYFSGIYFVIRITIMTLYFFPVATGYGIITLGVAISLCGLFVIILATFRPYKRNIHTFTATLSLLIIFVLSFTLVLLVIFAFIVTPNIFCFYSVGPVLAFFSLIVCCYCLIWILKKCKHALTYRVPIKKPPTIHIDQQNTTQSLVQDDDDENTPFADRLMNPVNYDERHVCSETRFT